MAGPSRQTGTWVTWAAGVSILLAVLAVTAAGLWVWSGREGSLATALKVLNVEAQGVRGNLRQGGEVGELRWQAGSGLRLEARQVSARWQLAELVQAALAGQPRVHLQQLAVQALVVHPAESAPAAAPPESLRLPWPVQLDQVRVGELSWAGRQPLSASELQGRYLFDGQAHQLTLSQARWAQGQYHGQARIEAQAPLRLSLRLQGELQSAMPGRSAALPVQLALQAQGPLAGFALQAQVRSTGDSRADLEARLAPWQDPPLPQAKAQFQALDLAAFWPGAPSTRLGGEWQVAPEGGRWQLRTELRNSVAAPWDRGGLPIERLSAEGQWEAGRLWLPRLEASVGRGQLSASGRRLGPSAWQFEARLHELPAQRLHSRWPARAVSGRLQARQTEGQPLAFEAELSGGEGQSSFQGQARGSWQAGQLSLEVLALRSPEARLQASGRWHLPSRSGQGQAQLQAPGLSLDFHGAWPLAHTAGGLQLKAQLQPTLAWLRGLPLPWAWPPALAALEAEGQAQAELAWPAGLADAQVSAHLQQMRLSGLPWAAQGVNAELQGRLSQARWQLQGELAGPLRLAAQAAGQLSLPLGAALSAWTQRTPERPLSLQLDQVAVQTQAADQPWRLHTREPLRLQLGWRGLQAQPGRLWLQGPGSGLAELGWQALSSLDGQWQSQGRLRGLPQAWAESLAGGLARSGLQGDLLFDGQWQLQLGTQLRLEAELARRSGDLQLQADTTGATSTAAATVAAGVREARLSLQAIDEALRLGWRWDSERAGQSEGELRTRLARQGAGWHWPESAPLEGRLQARLPRLGAWSVLAPPGWRLRGALRTNLAVGGTRAQPQLDGTLEADDLALRSVVDGIELGRGQLRARLEGQRLRLQTLSLRGPGPQGGLLSASGEADWRGGAPQVALQLRLARLRASVRSDRQLTVSGEVQARLDGLPTRRPVQLTGALRLDQARIHLPEEERPRLDADVRVRGAQPPAPSATGRLDLAIRLDLGDDFRVSGRGVDTRLRGSLAVTSQGLGSAPRLFGSLNTAEGEYRAYGQRLEIERGLLRFAGPADNPTLDILALRPNLSQRVGVQVTGTALLPRVRLFAEPELPEAEKLAWLVLGRSGAAGGAEAALVQQAAVALLGDRSALNPGALAASLGLDELSLRGGSSQADGTATGGVTLGKRLASNFYAAYESSLSGALGTLYLFYELSQRLTVRAQTGAQTAVDLIYTLPYD